MKRQHICLILICALLLMGAKGGCTNEQKTLVTAYETSAKIAQLTETAAVTIGTLYEGQLISFDTKETLTNKLKLVATNGKRFQSELDAIYAVYKDKIPPDKLSYLDLIFNRDVAAPFLDLFNSAGILSPETARKVQLALVAIKLAVMTISTIFSQKLKAVGKLSESYETSQKFAEFVTV